jgi:hypothetical protein
LLCRRESGGNNIIIDDIDDIDDIDEHEAVSGKSGTAIEPGSAHGA